MHLLAGLGNPGSKYAGNRHNVGFMVVDEIHRRFRFAPYRMKFEGEMSEGTIEGHKVLLLKPTTFMNDSGKSVGAAARFYKIPPENVIVLHDELDLAPGKIRAKTGGGVAGHNGLKSIAQHFGKDFRRVRIGIGHPGDKNQVTGHVLKDFSKADQDWVEKIIDAIAEASPLLLEDKDPEFMTKVPLILKPPKKNDSEKKEKKTEKPEDKESTD